LFFTVAFPVDSACVTKETESQRKEHNKKKEEEKKRRERGDDDAERSTLSLSSRAAAAAAALTPSTHGCRRIYRYDEIRISSHRAQRGMKWCDES
jgi:hypothetical protein